MVRAAAIVLTAAGLALASCDDGAKYATYPPSTTANAPGAPGVTQAGYTAVKPGMTYKEAAAILGGPGDEISSTAVGPDTGRVVSWTAADGSSNITLMLENERVMTKAKAGIE